MRKFIYAFLAVFFLIIAGYYIFEGNTMMAIFMYVTVVFMDMQYNHIALLEKIEEQQNEAPSK